MAKLPLIVLTPGEPAGIGPDVVVKIAQKNYQAGIVVVGDPDLLLARAKLLHLPLRIETFHGDAGIHQPGSLSIIPVSLKDKSMPGVLNKANAVYVLQCLELATDYCLQNQTSLVTGPVQKSILIEAGISFLGHTEFLAHRAGSANVIMLFVVDQLRVALMTTHMPLSAVPYAINAKNLEDTITLLDAELKSKFLMTQPRILVCGLNPHAGENGHLGREELDLLQPALDSLRKKGIQVQGPLPADTIFTPKHLAQADVVLAMYHDQALPVVKYLGFDRAVNVTLGLPFIRTSVDHGTALDIAGTGSANPGSLHAAIQLAINLSQSPNSI